MSDRPTGVATLEARIDDIRAVMDAVGSESANIFGMSEGDLPAADAFLVMYGAQPRWLRGLDYPWGPTEKKSNSSSKKQRRADGSRM